MGATVDVPLRIEGLYVDEFLAALDFGTAQECGWLIREGRVAVNGQRWYGRSVRVWAHDGLRVDVDREGDRRSVVLRVSVTTEVVP